MKFTKGMAAVAPAVLVAAAANAQSISADQQRAYQSELLADADSRTSLLAANGSAGYDGGFVIEDGSGNNSLRINGLLQTRYVINNRDGDSSPGVNDESTIGFTTPRTKLTFSGTVGDPNLGYKIQGNFYQGSVSSSSSMMAGGFVLEDAFATYSFDNGVTLRWGQFKPHLLREENVGDRHQLLVDRSTSNETANQDRTQGIEVEYTDEQWRFWGSFNDGVMTANNDFDGFAEADFGISGRAEWQIEGDDWSRFDDFTSFQGSDFAAMVGGAFHYQSGGETGVAGGGNTTDVDLLAFTIDGSVEGDGWNAFASFVWVHADPMGGTETDDLAFVIQGGIFVTEHTELFGRFDVILPDSSRTNDDTFSTFAIGANHYVFANSHNFKLSGQISFFPDELVSTTTGPNIVSPNNLIGLLPAGAGQDSQFALLLQAQVAF